MKTDAKAIIIRPIIFGIAYSPLALKNRGAFLKKRECKYFLIIPQSKY